MAAGVGGWPTGTGWRGAPRPSPTNTPPPLPPSLPPPPTAGMKAAEVDPANFDLVMAINTKGIFLGCQAVLPHMVKANCA